MPGTPGNRTGYKVYSINTTVRNPKRNIEFLEIFKNFSGKPFDSKAKEKYLAECVKTGVYRFTNVSQSIKDKLDNDIDLTSDEVDHLFKNNPQATGFANRVVTQLRSLKDQCLIDFAQGARSKNGAMYEITFLGRALLENVVSASDIYTISMIASHGKSPIRTTMFNETRPFLNTLFVMDEVKRYCEKHKMEFKGLLLHEFGTFVLGMKDCNFRKAAKDIIEYRRKYGKVANLDFINDYLFNKQCLLYLKYETLMAYVDDVFRKFELTGLLRKRGAFKYIYIDFSVQNYGKVKQIIDKFDGYYWHDFKTKEEYYKFVESIELPWIQNSDNKKEVLLEKAEALGVDASGFTNIDQLEQHLNEVSGQTAISKQINNFSFNEIISELLILSGDSDKKPGDMLDDLSEPLRLEFLLALLFGKKYGSEYVVSNLIYNDDGEPLSFAPGGKADISFHHKDLNLLIEATMIRNKTQQLNSETANLSRHLDDIKNKSGKEYGLTLVAPYIHRDTCDYFAYVSDRRHLEVCPLTISRIGELVQISDTPLIFKNNFSIIVSSLIFNINTLDKFLSFINSEYLSFISDKSVYTDSYLKTLYLVIKKAYSENKILLKN